MVIFDCDGVLFDSRDANIAFYNKILAYFEKAPVRPEECDMVHMRTAQECIEYFFRNDPRLQEAQRYRKNLRYDEFIPFVKQEPYLQEVLRALHRRYHLAIATNRTGSIHSILKVFDLENHFDLVVCALDVEQPKPHPEAVWKILDHFGAAADETVYFGDTVVDQEVSVRSNVTFVAYRNPGLGAQYHVRTMQEVLLLLSNDNASDAWRCDS